MSVILVLALSTFGCDPGIDYVPKDWAATNGQRTKTFGPLEIQIDRLGGLIGAKWLNPEIVIRNHGKSPAVVKSITLKANGSEYVARPFYEKQKVWETVPPNEMRKIEPAWEFDRPISAILKDPVDLILMIKIENEITEITIPMVKDVR
jgi:hypothetical protein